MRLNGNLSVLWKMLSTRSHLILLSFFCWPNVWSIWGKNFSNDAAWRKKIFAENPENRRICTFSKLKFCSPVPPSWRIPKIFYGGSPLINLFKHFWEKSISHGLQPSHLSTTSAWYPFLNRTVNEELWQLSNERTRPLELHLVLIWTWSTSLPVG